MALQRKFDNTDRHRVIAKIGKKLGRHLDKVGTSDAVVQDDGGKIYVVIGGRDEWARVENKQLEALTSSDKDPVLVWAHRQKNRIDLYHASLKAFLWRKDIFENMNFTADGRIARVKGTDLRLEKWFDFPYSEVEHESQQQMDKAGKELDKLSDDQLRQLAEKRGLTLATDDESE